MKKYTHLWLLKLLLACFIGLIMGACSHDQPVLEVIKAEDDPTFNSNGIWLKVPVENTVAHYIGTDIVYDGELGERIVNNLNTHSMEYVCYKMPERADYFRILYQNEDTYRIAILYGIEENQTGDFSQVAALYGINKAEDIDSISVSAITKRDEDYGIQQIDITDASIIEAFYSKIENNTMIKTEQYVAGCLKRGYGNYMEEAVLPEIGSLRERKIVLSTGTGSKMEIFFDPVSRHIIGSNGTYAVDSDCCDDLVNLMKIDLNKEKYLEMAEKRKDALEAQKRLDKLYADQAVEIQSQDFFAGTYLKGTKLLVFVTDSMTEEQKEKLLNVAAFEDISFENAEHTIGSLSKVWNSILDDQAAGQLPFVLNSYVDVEKNRIVIEIQNDSEDNLNILRQYEQSNMLLVIVKLQYSHGLQHITS